MSKKYYKVDWLDIYKDIHTNIVRADVDSSYEYFTDHIIHAIPHRGDRFDKVVKTEEVIWDDKLKQWIPKLKPYDHSKVPVFEGPNIDFVEYSYEIVPNQGEITDFKTAHDIAVSLLKEKPDTVLLKEDENWFIGKIDPIKKKAQWRTNYDYGESLHMNLDKYKSVMDFRKKRRAKRKKDIENILNSRPDRYKPKKKK